MDLEILLTQDNVPQDVKDVIKEYLVETKKIQQALQESENRYRYLIQTIPDIVYCLNEDGIFTFVNDSVKNIGYTPEELIGTHFTHILHPDDIEKVSSSAVLNKYKGKTCVEAPKLFDERRTGDRKTTNLELRLISKGDETKTGLMETVTKIAASGLYNKDITNPDKEFLGTIGVIRDITELKKAEDELKASQDQVKHLEKFLRVCASCHKVLLPKANDSDMESWWSMEDYITEKTSTVFSHGLCPLCYERAIQEIK